MNPFPSSYGFGFHATSTARCPRPRRYLARTCRITSCADWPPADALAEELTLLRQAVNRLDQISQAHAAAVESALLARAHARPEQVAIAHAAIKRLGIESLPA